MESLVALPVSLPRLHAVRGTTAPLVGLYDQAQLTRHFRARRNDPGALREGAALLYSMGQAHEGVAESPQALDALCRVVGLSFPGGVVQ